MVCVVRLKGGEGEAVLGRYGEGRDERKKVGSCLWCGEEKRRGSGKRKEEIRGRRTANEMLGGGERGGSERTANDRVRNGRRKEITEEN